MNHADDPDLGIEQGEEFSFGLLQPFPQPVHSAAHTSDAFFQIQAKPFFLVVFATSNINAGTKTFYILCW